MDDLADTLKDLTINNAEYYVSNLANLNNAKGNPVRYLKTVTHTSNRKENFADASNGNFEENY